MRCHNCGQIGHKAVDCPKEVICRICHQSGHISNDCPKYDNNRDNGIKCFNCGRYGHKSFECFQGRGGRNGFQFYNENKCYNCGQTGHKSFECKELPHGKNCYKCGKPGHISTECPGEDNIDNGSSNNGIKCPVCNEDNGLNNKTFSMGVCGHVLCDECWEKTRRNKEAFIVKCDLCQKSFEKNELKRVTYNIKH